MTPAQTALFWRQFSAACLDAAERAWKYLEDHPFDGTGFVNLFGLPLKVRALMQEKTGLLK